LGLGQLAFAGVNLLMTFYKIIKIQIIYFLLPLFVCFPWIFLSYADGGDVLMSNSKTSESAGEEFCTHFIRVIVQLKIKSLVEEHEEKRKQLLIAQARAALIRDLGSTSYRVNRVYNTIPFVALEVSPAALQVLKKSAFVAGIEEDSLSLPPLR
jgi:hypothetical protein